MFWEGFAFGAVFVLVAAVFYSWAAATAQKVSDDDAGGPL